MTKENKYIDFIDSIFRHIVKGDVIKDAQLSGNVFTSFVFVGIFTNLFFRNMYSSTGTYGPASSLIWGYSIIVISILSIIFLNNVNNIPTSISGISKIINAETLLLLLLLIWIIFLNINNSKKINSGKLPKKFYTYSDVSSMIVFFQIIFFFMNIVIPNINKNNNNTDVQNVVMQNLAFINYLLLFLNFILIVIQQIILDNFSVDIL